MGILASIIGAISDDVVATLAAASYPALTDGKILVGSAAAFEQSAPPRIIFEPAGSTFSDAEYSSASSTLGTQERKVQNAQRTIALDTIEFKVRCWGALVGGTPVDDYDVTRGLYMAVRASMHRVMPGNYVIDARGKYTTGAHVARDGREFVFGLQIFSPILFSLLPYDRTRQYAPDNVAPAGTVVLNTATTEGIPVS